MPRLLTDFNHIDGKGTVYAQVAPSQRADVGDRVLLHDDGESEAWATVTGVNDDLVTAELDWDTWGPAGRY